jgi:hypothetical protein
VVLGKGDALGLPLVPCGVPTSDLATREPGLKKYTHRGGDVLMFLDGNKTDLVDKRFCIFELIN